MTLLRAERVFDGSRMTSGTTVALDGAEIGRSTDAAADEVVELPGATLLPGLIDTHQHLVFDGNGSFEEQVSPHDDETLRTRAHAHARKALAAGITTLRDLGDRGYVTLALRGLEDVGTIVASGPPLTRRRGHCWYLGGEADGEVELRAAVRERAHQGCDVVKIMITGGHGTPGFAMWDSQYSAGEVAAVVDEASRLGLPVAAHCHGLAGIEAALDSGVASIEHCTFMSAEEQRSNPRPDLLERLARSGIGLSFSLGSLDFGAAPAFVQENMRTLLQAVAELFTLGARVCVGTDAGIAPPKPHDVLPTALTALVEAGVEPASALGSLTSTAADVIGLGSSKGRLLPGFDGDVLAVDGDPLEDPAALLRVVGVWHRGRRVR